MEAQVGLLNLWEVLCAYDDDFLLSQSINTFLLLVFNIGTKFLFSKFYLVKITSCYRKFLIYYRLWSKKSRCRSKNEFFWILIP
jgi:hypothetical protein